MNHKPLPHSQNGGNPETEKGIEPVAAVPGVLAAATPISNFEFSEGRYTAYVEEQPWDWQHLRMLLERRWKIMLFAFVATVLAALLFTLFTRPTYLSSAQLLLNLESKSTLSSLSNTIPGLQGLVESTGARSQETEVEIIKSYDVQNAAKERIPVSAKEFISQPHRITVAPIRNTDLVSISVVSRDEAMSKELANAICRTYIDQKQEENSAQYRGIAAYIKDQLDSVRSQLDRSRRQMAAFKRQENLMDLPAEGQAQVARLNEVQSQLSTVRADRDSGMAQLQELRSLAGKMSPTEKSQRTEVARPIVTQLKEELTRLEAQKVSLQQEFTNDSPEIRVVEGQIASLRARLQKEAQTEVGTSVTTVNPVRQQVLQNIASTQSMVWANEARIQALQKSLTEARASINQLPSKELRLSELQSDLLTYQQLYQNLSDRYQTVRISQAAPMSNARVISAATPAVKVGPRLSRNMMLGIIMGLLLSLSLALLAERLDDKVHSERDALIASGLPVLAHLPTVDDANRLIVENGKQVSGALLESYRVLRTNLAFSSINGSMRSIIVTSSQPHEGKSSVASNLAAAMALNGKRVLLLDADLRRSTVNKIFNISNQTGLSSVIAGFVTLEDAIQPSSVDNLFILPSGPTPPNPPELLDSEKMRHCLQELQTQFDLVVVDAPPALGMADAQILSRMVDGVLVVVSYREANRRAVARMTELLSQGSARMLGVALNKQPVSARKYGYYGYGYGYGYGYSYSPNSDDKSQETPPADKKTAPALQESTNRDS